MGWNILKEQIFPVIYASGKRASLGMYDILKEADKIQEIHTGCPGDFGDFLLTRLLTSFVQAAYQFCKTDLSDKLDALAEGSMDMNKIDRYIQYCENKGVSFELTGNGERLFLQPETDLEELKKIRVLNIRLRLLHIGFLPGTQMFSMIFSTIMIPTRMLMKRA